MGNIRRLLSLCKVSIVDGTVLTNEWGTWSHKEEDSSDGSGKNSIFRNEVARRPFKEFTPLVVSDDEVR